MVAIANPPRKKANMKKSGRKSADNGADTKYPPELLKRVHELEKLLSDSGEAEVRTMVQVGRAVQEIIEDKETYGGVKFKEVAGLFRTGRDTLRPGYVLAKRYTDVELDHLFKLKNATTGAGLHRAHLAVLSRVEDKGTAMKLAKQTVEEGLTKGQLVRQVLAIQGGPGSAGGRKRKALKSLLELWDQGEEWFLNLAAQDMKVWRHGGSFQKLLDEAVANPDKRNIEGLNRFAQAMAELQTRLDAWGPDLAKAKRLLTA